MKKLYIYVCVYVFIYLFVYAYVNIQFFYGALILIRTILSSGFEEQFGLKNLFLI